MSHYEYIAIPAPHEGEASSAAQTPQARLADAVTVRLNAMAGDGWTYLRSDEFTLNGVEGKQAVLIFRRESDFGVFAGDKPEYGTFATP
ncbi:hypothetical protein HCZ23_02535 [Celeribacter sp. HF31]|uniref:hypothetical protein n=1 Tax=Celeribacter sp. HF31 TaxID=2721558 RepID=UPI00142F8F77|nr:hypothetical protein [Celeribacter sp. HF31]NIY78346.1 hypothetical protein [Celeribacter sp. HF31]